MKIRMTYCYPEQTRWGQTEEGKPVLERAPQSRTRPAYDHEINCWWEEVPDQPQPARN